MAVSGLLFHRFAKNLTAAILPKAAAKLELRKTAARDPLRTFDAQWSGPYFLKKSVSGESGGI
jgi:hypothetical protein